MELDLIRLCKKVHYVECWDPERIFALISQPEDEILILLTVWPSAGNAWAKSISPTVKTNPPCPVFHQGTPSLTDCPWPTVCMYFLWFSNLSRNHCNLDLVELKGWICCPGEDNLLRVAVQLHAERLVLSIFNRIIIISSTQLSTRPWRSFLNVNDSKLALKWRVLVVGHAIKIIQSRFSSRPVDPSTWSHYINSCSIR